jgi:hypothetical protein
MMKDMETNLSRRDFLKIGGFTALATALWGCSGYLPGKNLSTATPPSQTNLLINDGGAALTLRRITYGPTAQDVARLHTLGLEAFIQEQLHPDSIQDPGVDALLAGLTTLTMNPADLAAVSPRNLPGQELMSATLVRAVYSNRQLYELMVGFWSDHFNIYLGKNLDRYLKTVDDRQVVRSHALGRFADLLLASAQSPAMLFYLDNATSTKAGPNENYARELMELHTLSLAAGYSQTDVEQVARALTGWSISGPNSANPGEFLYRPAIHDDGEKTILGTNFPAGQGEKDGEQLLALLAGHPSTANFISTKLARRFVADLPPASLVSRAAATFQATGGDLLQVVSSILNSDEFRASLGQKLKRPLEFIASALRQTGAQAAIGRPVLNFLGLMGQLPFEWESPNGYPDIGSAWLSTNDLMARWNFALALAAGSIPDVKVDWQSLAGSAATFDDALQNMSLALLGGLLPDQARIFLGSQLQPLPISESLPLLGALLLASPYFQYR